MSMHVDDREVIRMFQTLRDDSLRRKIVSESLSEGAYYLMAALQRQIRNYSHVIKYARGPKGRKVGPGLVRGFVDTGFMLNSVSVAGPGNQFYQNPVEPVTRRKKGQRLLPKPDNVKDNEAIVYIGAEYAYYVHRRWPFFKEMIEWEFFQAFDVIRDALAKRLSAALGRR